MRALLSAVFAACLLVPAATAAEPKPLKILFLGDNGHHKPADRYRQFAPAMFTPTGSIA